MLDGQRLLIAGASSDLASSLVKKLYDGGAVLGLHYSTDATPLSKYIEDRRVGKFQKNLDSSEACFQLVDAFANWAGGLDGLIQLVGNISRPVHWEELTYADWQYDLSINLVMPFFLVQRAVS